MSKKQKYGYGDWTKLDAEMFMKPAFHNLNAAGHGFLTLLLAKRQFSKSNANKKKGVWVRTDDNKFDLTHKELTSFGYSPGRIIRGIDDLLAKGFIKIAHKGGAYDKDKNLYALTDDYKKWRLGDPPIRTRPKDVRRGYQGQGKGVMKKIIARKNVGRDTRKNIVTQGKDTRINVDTLPTRKKDSNTEITGV